MAIRDILVHVDNCRACRARVDVALDLAIAHEARLTGLYVIPSIEIPIYIEGGVPPGLIEEQRNALDAQRTEADGLFHDLVQRGKLKTNYVALEGGVASCLNRSARHADLVVVGQADDEDPRCVSGGLADTVVLESGRPVLVVPAGGFSGPVGERVLIAWNGSREAVRAVADAMPFLERAERVEVVVVIPNSGDENDSSQGQLVNHLRHHDIAAETTVLVGRDSLAGELLLGHAVEMGADLLVLGGYGHSRLRELVLGGTTKHLLQNMTAPLLMSH